MVPSLRYCAAVLVACVICTIGAAAEPVTPLVLAPTADNPRNSEGDFIRLSDGRLLFVYTHFTGGTSDHAQAYLASRESTDGGRTWSDESQKVIDREGDMNVMSVSLLRLQGVGDAPGPIGLFYLVKNSTEHCHPVMRVSTDEAKTWSEPRTIIPDDQSGYYVLNNDRVLQLESGRLVVPVAEHFGPSLTKWNGAANILCYTSDDGGKTWARGEQAAQPEPITGRGVTCQEPGVVALADGRLMIFCRTNGGSQFVAYSTDEGTTWSQLVPSNISSPMSPATIERIPGTKDLLLVWNNHENIAPALKGKRTPLAIAISSDNGQTWKNVKNLEDNPSGWYCYIAVDFVENAVVLGYCSGDREKMNGLAQTSITRIGLDWLRGGK